LEEFYELPGAREIATANPTVDSDNQQSLLGEPFVQKTLKVLPDSTLLQLHQTYIIASTNSGFILVHQQLAHERVLYERYSMAAHGQRMATQQSLFPAELEMTGPDAVLLKELIPDLLAIGYQLEQTGDEHFVIQGIPADILAGNENMQLNY